MVEEKRISIGKVITSAEGLRHCADALENAGHYDDVIMEHFVLICPDGRITTGIDLDKTSDKCGLSEYINYGEQMCESCNGSGIGGYSERCGACNGRGVIDG